MVVIRTPENENFSGLDTLDFDTPFAGKLDSSIGTFGTGDHSNHLVVSKPSTHISSEFCPTADFSGDIGQSDWNSFDQRSFFSPPLGLTILELSRVTYCFASIPPLL